MMYYYVTELDCCNCVVIVGFHFKQPNAKASLDIAFLGCVSNRSNSLRAVSTSFSNLVKAHFDREGSLFLRYGATVA